MPVFANVDIVTASEANDIISDINPLILDVRNPSEYELGHIDGAINLPLDQLNDETVVQFIGDKDKPVLVYCASGTRSSIACGMLVEMGYENVYDLAGGIKSWPFGVV